MTPASLGDVEAFVARARDAAPTPHDLAEAINATRRFALTDLTVALRCARALVDLAPAKSRESISARTALGHVMSYSGQLEDAVALLQAAAAEADEYPADRAQVQLALIQPLARLGRLELAADVANAAAEALARDGRPIESAKARTNQGIVLRMRGAPEAALQAFDAAAPALASDAVATAVVDSNRAEALLDLDRFDDAAEAFERARAGFLAAGNTHAAAIVEGNIADLLSRLGRLSEALPRFERAREVFEAGGSHPDVARLYAEEAEALGAYGAWREARARFAQALRVLDAAGLKRELARAHLAYASMLVRQGDLRAALLHIDQSTAATSTLQGASHSPDLEVLVNAARAASEPEPQRCLSAMIAALDQLRSRPILYALRALDAATVLLDAGRIADASGIVESLQGQQHQPTAALLVARQDVLRARLAKRTQTPGEAAALFRKALDSTERVRLLGTSGRLRAQFNDAWHTLSVEACAAALDAGRPSQAFDAVERFRSRSLLDMLEQSMPALELNQGPLQDRVRLVRERLNVMYARGQTGSTPQDASIAQTITDLEHELELAVARVEQATPQLHGAGHVPPMGELAAAVPEDTAVISYFLEERGYGAFVLTTGAVAVYRGLESAAGVSGMCRRLRLLVDEFTRDVPSSASGEDRAWTAVTSGIYQSIVAPLAPSLGDRRHIVVVPCGELHSVPFHGLHTGHQWWHDSVDVRYAPGVAVARAISARAEMPEAGSLVVGVPDPAAPRMGDEAQAVGRLMPGAKVLVAHAATERSIMDLARRASVLHLATHCVFSPLRPGLSRFKLGDGWISASELARGLAPGCVVVLAGCDSGRSAHSPGEDRLGIVRLFLAACCRLAVHAQWKLHDDTTFAIMSAFYRTIAGGQAGLTPRIVASALNESQRFARQQGIRPAAWATLFVSGGMS